MSAASIRCAAQMGGALSPLVAPLTFLLAPAGLEFVSYLSHRGVSSTCPWVVAAPGGPWAGWFQRRCARAPSLTSVLVPGLAPGGDKMFDGVIPLGEALRPLSLSRRSTRRRPTCRQNDAGSRLRRIGMTKGLTRANDLLEEVRGSGVPACWPAWLPHSGAEARVKRPAHPCPRWSRDARACYRCRLTRGARLRYLAAARRVVEGHRRRARAACGSSV